MMGPPAGIKTHLKRLSATDDVVIERPPSFAALHESGGGTSGTTKIGRSSAIGAIADVACRSDSITSDHVALIPHLSSPSGRGGVNGVTCSPNCCLTSHLPDRRG